MNIPHGGDASSPQRKKLPVNPSLEHLQKQAKRLVKLTPSLKLAAAQHQIAKEYGCKNWAELAHVVETMSRGADQLANVQRRIEPLPQAARAADEKTIRRILESGEFTSHDLDAALAHALWYVHETSWSACKAIADLLVEHGADPDGQYGSAYGPIVFGTGECVQPESLQYLIDAGANVTFSPIQTKYGAQCPLSAILGTYGRGANDRRHRYIEILLGAGAYIPPEVTPPILAIHRGDAKGLGELLDRDPGLLTRRFPDMPYGNIELRGATLLHCAVEFGEIECLEELFKRYVDINLKADVIDGIGGQTPIFHAINTNGDNNFSTLEYLVKRVGPWIDMSVRATSRAFGEAQSQPMTPLEYAEHAARTGDPQWRSKTEEELTLLRSLDRMEQLKSALLSEDAEKVTSLLDDYPKLISPALWPIAIFQAKSLSMTRLLLDQGVNPDECSAPRKPLHLAVYQCLPDIVELLIARGADVNLRNPLGETPLDLLDAYEPRPVGDHDALRIRAALLRAGATDDLYSVIRAGETDRLKQLLVSDPQLAQSDSELGGPLFVAARSGRVEVTRLLLGAGADPNKTNEMRNTPLWFAAQSPASPASNRIAVMQLLLDARADIHRRCEDGSTALHFAAWRGPVEVVDFLLSRGARNWIEDDNGELPLDYAKGSTVSPDQAAIIERLTGPRILDPVFRQAVTALTAGDVETLRRLFQEFPTLIHARAEERGEYAGEYFTHPTLLHFVAENPTRSGRLSANILEMTQLILDAGAMVDAVTSGSSPSTTLGLVATSQPAREQGHQLPLIELLVRNGAEPRLAFFGAAIHRETAALNLLLRLANDDHTLVTAASTGTLEVFERLLREVSDPVEWAEAANVAIVEGHGECLRLLLDAGLSVSARVPHHPYSPTLLHQAGSFGRAEIAEFLIERGADLHLRDTQYRGTPADWAEQNKHVELAKRLRAVAARKVI